MGIKKKLPIIEILIVVVVMEVVEKKKDVILGKSKESCRLGKTVGKQTSKQKVSRQVVLQ